MDNFDPYNVFLAIATNIPVLLKTAFVAPGITFRYQFSLEMLPQLIVLINCTKTYF